MSVLPNPVMDPRGDPREGTFEIPAPPPEVDDSFIKMHLGKPGHPGWKKVGNRWKLENFQVKALCIKFTSHPLDVPFVPSIEYCIYCIYSIRRDIKLEPGSENCQFHTKSPNHLQTASHPMLFVVH